MTQSSEPSYDRMDIDLFQSNKMSSSSPRFQTVAVVLIGVVAAIALVFSAIALARPGTMGITVPVQGTAGNTGIVYTCTPSVFRRKWVDLGREICLGNGRCF